jgi:hypothetical protein
MSIKCKVVNSLVEGVNWCFNKDVLDFFKCVKPAKKKKPRRVKK